MNFAPGTRLGHYILGAPLGAGGMGEVYRATDTRLDRTVALKVLPADVASHPDRLDRFRREAKVLAALDHPNIVTVYSVEEVGPPPESGQRTVHFLTMQLVEGQSLEEAIPAGGLPLERVLHIAPALAEALAAAHDKGIVHRDLKPANVMLAADRVKVLDFGLAKELGSSGPADTTRASGGHTQQGVVMGTPAYMSPEQLAGRDVDHRTDLFSLGVVLYQMVTGRRPFDGASSIELASAILRDTPALVDYLRGDLPAGLARLIHRCLEKDARQRIRSAREVADACRALARSVAPPGVRQTPDVHAEMPDLAARTDDGFWVAVLPFRSASQNQDVAALVEGLSEAIVSGLSRFSYLRVIARSSTERYAREPADVRTVGRQIGARYVMEGTLRHVGSQVRVVVQLIDSTTGTHLWDETYDRPFSGDAIFALQDDLVPRIVSTVADGNGALPRSMGDALRGRAARELTPYEAVLKGWGFYARIAPEEHAEVRDTIEHAVGQANTNGDLWALLSTLYLDEYRHGFNPQPAPLDRALSAVRRAIDLAPSNHFAYYSLASVLFFRRDLPAFRRAAERALELNPMDANSLAYMGNLIAYAGEWTRGIELVDRAIGLNRHHPGWFWFSHFSDAYRRRDYAAALDAVVRVNMPDYYWATAMRAAVHGQLGQHEAAAEALRQLQTLSPDFARIAREELSKWYVETDVVEHLMDGFRKAGLEINPLIARITRTSEPSTPADATVAIAVLPFADMSPAQDQQYLCEGMAEEIMNALVPIRGIRVASRTSAFRARHDYRDLAAIAQALSVNHILEGSVRTAGSRLRVTAQLTDVASGYQTWSNRFDRDAADVFAIQDEIAAGVVDAVKTRLAPGEQAGHSRAKTQNLDAYRSYLKGRHLRGIEDHAGALQAFEEAVRLDPSHAPSWTGLAEITVLSSVFNFSFPRPACDAARRALDTARSLQGESADGWHVEAFACWIERRWDEMEAAWRRALEIEPRHVLALGSFGAVLCTRQRFEEAVPILERARDADPLGSFPYALTGIGYLNCGRLRDAERHLDDALSFEEDDVTALYGQAMTKVALGKVADGVALAERAVTLSHRGGVFVGIFGWALATAGRTTEARALLAELRTRPAGSSTVVAEGWLLGALGEIDPAFDVLARAEEECQANLYFTGLPVFDALRGDPRFTGLLARLGLPNFTNSLHLQHRHLR